MSGKICVICGKSFPAKMVTQKVCGEECRMEYKRRDARERGKLREHREHPEAVCAICGKSFMQKNNVQKYCGPACLIEADKLRRKKKTEAAAEERQKAGRICPACGKSFVPNSGKQIVCSYPCSLLADRARRSKGTIEEQAAWEKEQAAQEKPKPAPAPRKLSPLAQTVEEARAHGLSYGLYTAQYITPERELQKAQKAMRTAEDQKELEKAQARALELEHEIKVIRRTL